MYDVYTTLLSLQSLLTDPNPKSPANPEAAKYVIIHHHYHYLPLLLIDHLIYLLLTLKRLYETDKDAYNKKIIECVEKTWDEEGI